MFSLCAFANLGSRHFLWGQTTGTVIGHSEETVCGARGGGSCKSTYYPQIAFGTSSANATYTFVSRQKGPASRYPEGAEVEVLYNPWSPQKAETLRQSMVETQIAGIVAFAMTVASALVVGLFVYNNPSTDHQPKPLELTYSEMAETVDGREFT